MITFSGWKSLPTGSPVLLAMSEFGNRGEFSENKTCLARIARQTGKYV